jgi:two-component system, NarL family, invasion response regulator UvrY
MIEVLVVDDHTIFRSGLKRLFSDEPDIRVADEARNSAEALTKIRGHKFDVVLLDINMEGRSGLELLDSVRAEFPKLPVLVLSMYPEEQYALVALKAGANGYVSKDIESDELVHAVRQVASGARYLTERAAQKLLLRPDDATDDRPAHQKLSVREHEIMLLIVKGMSLTEIGEKTFISVKTVSTYRTRILQKLGLASNAELVRYAMRHGIIS